MSAPVVVIGLGNGFRGDDGVGLELTRRLLERPVAGVEVAQPEDALAILAAWEGAELAVVVDAACSGASPGTIQRLEVGNQVRAKDLGRCSSHGQGLAEALALGGALGRLPARIVLYAIEGRSFAHGPDLSAVVEAALPKLEARIRAELGSRLSLFRRPPRRGDLAMLDRRLIGQCFAPQTVTVEAGALRLFAKAIGETDPVYLDPKAARARGFRDLPAPLTYVMCLQGACPEPWRWLDRLGVDYDRLLHGEQAFDYVRPICAGDRLTLCDRIVDIYEKKAGALEFVVIETTVTDQAGQPVASARSTAVVRNR